MPPLHLKAEIERFPIAGAFTISRGSRREAVVVVATVSDGGHVGRGEGVPYARYGEAPEAVLAAILSLAPLAAEGRLDRETLAERLGPGAARNAVDCALWDFEAKQTGRPVHVLAGLRPPHPATTAYTISLGTPEAMAEAAEANADRPLLKVKLGGIDDAARIAAVREAAPQARLIVDANEGWRPDELEKLLAACAKAGVEVVEQPLAHGADRVLARFRRPVPVCADESCHVAADLAGLRGRYDAVNVKLDKAGGLSEAIRLAAEAEWLGFKLMVGCMVATSLAMAPATLLAPQADWVDLDGPLLLARDRAPALRYDGSTLHPPETELWG